uniref:Uncharacterized protein n=1 Tax=Ditylenchus dipsaci TaxID=166011 RepID=A0A915CSW7_9BILA
MGRICPRTCDKENNNHSACTKIAELHHFRKEHVPIKKDCNDSGSGCAKNIMLCEDEYYIDKWPDIASLLVERCVKPDFVCEDKKGSP